MQVSILLNTRYPNLKSLSVSTVLTEFLKKNPTLFRLILSSMLGPKLDDILMVKSAGPNSKDEVVIKPEKLAEIMPRLMMVYAIIEQTNFQELSLVQSVVSVFLHEAFCEQKVCIIHHN